MNQAWRFALRDLRGSKAGLRLLAICLFLGVATLASVGSLTSAITAELSARGQAILGGDLELRVAQRFAEPAELDAFREAGRVSRTVSMRAMAATPDESRSVLVELKGVDSAYPLYGDFRLEPGALGPRPSATDAAIAPALADKLGLEVGDRFRMGEALFRVSGIVAEEPDRVGAGFTLGPVALVDDKGLEATNLVQPGSLFTTRYRVRTPAGADPAALGDTIVRRFPSAGWEVQDRSNGAPGTRRFIERLGQFLSLVGLAALAIAGIGVGNGVSSWLEGKRGSIATLKVLGAPSRMIFRTYLLEIGLVAALAILLGLAAGALAPWAIASIAGSALPVQPRLALYPLPLMTAAVYGVLIALTFSLAPLARARAVTAQSLFRTGVEGAGRPPLPVMLGMGALGGMIAALAIATAREPWFAAAFVASVLGLIALLTLLGAGIRKLAAALPRPRTPLTRLALANLHRPGAQTARLVVALGLGLTLFATLGVIQTSLTGQIERTIPKRAPSFFVLDIPATEEAGFRQAVASAAPGAGIATVPSLRGPVVAIRGQRVADMKDIPDNAWFLRGDRGLTFARDLPEGSRVVEGAWWPRDYAGPPLVSLDVEAARAAGLKVGDMLTIAVLGVEIEAKIASLREINWDTLGFNFVLVFSPGTLEAAPHTLMATIATDVSREPALGRAITAAFPSASMIRVKEVIEQVGGILSQLSAAVAVAASVAVLAGIAVLVGAIAASRRRRDYDSVLLKLLGGTRAQVLGAQAIEYAALAVLLSGIALVLGAGAGWYVVTQIFELEWMPDWGVVLGLVAAGGAGTLMLGLLGALPALSARPAAALRAL